VKYPSEAVGYQFTVVLFFPRRLLFDFYKTLSVNDIPRRDARSRKPVVKIAKSATLISLFDSFRPYWVAGDQPNEDWLKMKVLEAIRFLSHADPGAFASLFDFTSPWRLDIIDFMEKNYMYDLTVDELARYTGRSVATFKRDFSKVSDLTPRHWLIQRRLEAARQLLITTDLPVSHIFADVGFKNFSHFSKAYREYFGETPTQSRAK
jgi:AraC-like DNA-binding protein